MAGARGSGVSPAGGADIGRVPAVIKKQFMGLRGVPVLEWSVRAFIFSGVISETVLVVAEDDADKCGLMFGPFISDGRLRVVPGGATRRESVAAGAAALGAACEIVAVHDGARPFASAALIRACVRAAARAGAACAAVRVTDTIKIADGPYAGRVSGGEAFSTAGQPPETAPIIVCTPDRATLWSAQTPQAFRRGLLLEALERAAREGADATDDAGLVERLGYRVEIVEGSYDNIKITTPADFELAGLIAARLPPPAYLPQ